MDVSVTSNADTLNAAMLRLTRELPGDVADQAVRKVAADVVADIQRGLSGNVASVTRRVDEGRLRGSYGAGLAKVGGSPLYKGAASDGIGQRRAGLTSVELDIGSNLDYATYVEEGTPLMDPGNHVARALGTAAQGLPLQELEQELGRAIEEAWEGL